MKAYLYACLMTEEQAELLGKAISTTPGMEGFPEFKVMLSAKDLENPQPKAWASCVGIAFEKYFQAKKLKPQAGLRLVQDAEP